jgi:hypothetical protein
MAACYQYSCHGREPCRQTRGECAMRPGGLKMTPESLRPLRPISISRHILEIGQLLEKLEIADQPAVVICPSVPCFISPSFSEICGSKFSKIFETALDRGETIPVRNNSPALQQARVARENHLTSFPRKLENEVLRNPIKVPEGELLHDRVPRLLLRAPRSMPPLPRRNCKLSLK